MADDDAHHRAVQETVNRQRVLTAPFESPPDQPSVVETNAHFIGRFIPTQWNLNSALWQNPAVDQPTFTQQEQPDHPQSHTWPGVQDPLATEPTSGPLPGQKGRDGGVMLVDGSVIFPVTAPSSGVTPAFGVAPPMPAGLRPTILGQPIGPRSDFSPLDFDSGDFHQRPPAPHNPPTELKAELDKPTPFIAPRKSIKGRPRACGKVARFVVKNAAEIELIGASLVLQIDQRLEALRLELERLNFEESLAAVNRAIADWDDLKRKLEAFLEAASRFAAKKTDDGTIAQKTCSLVDAICDWFSKRHVQICDRAFDKALQASDVGLFATVLGLCLLAGAGPDLSVAIPGAWFGGKPVVDAIKACLKPGRS